MYTVSSENVVHKSGFKKGLPALIHSNQTVFLVQFGIVCTCKFFRKLKLYSPKWLVQYQLTCAN